MNSEKNVNYINPLPNVKKIIDICSDYLLEFESIIKDMTYEIKGIFNSEMLLFISLCKYFDVKLIIESGRAIGQSTKIIAECFKGSKYKIYSIEKIKYSQDVKASFKRLKNYQNLNLLFNNSLELIPKLITEDCCILIDGPKEQSIEFAIDLLKNPLVKVVCIHDIHKDSIRREEFESIFHNYFFTDELSYVEQFKHLDKACWLALRKFRKYQNWAPYRRDNKKMKSYFATLVSVFNSDKPVNLQYLNAHPKIQRKKERKSFHIKIFFKEWSEILRNIIGFPGYFIFYKKKFNKKQKINLKDLLLKWIHSIKEIIKPLIFN